MILRKETETVADNSVGIYKSGNIRMNDTPQGDGNFHLSTPFTLTLLC